MNYLKRTLILLVSVILGRAETVSLGAKGTFDMVVPTGWTLRSSPAEQIGYVMALKPSDGVHAKCLITLAYLPKPAPINKAELDDRVTEVGQRLVQQSVEKKVELRSFGLVKGYGVYSVFTDASLVGKPPKGDDYLILGSGVMQLGEGVMVVVSVFADDKEGADFKAMLKSLSTIVVRESK